MRIDYDQALSDFDNGVKLWFVPTQGKHRGACCEVVGFKEKVQVDYKQTYVKLKYNNITFQIQAHYGKFYDCALEKPRVTDFLGFGLNIHDIVYVGKSGAKYLALVQQIHEESISVLPFDGVRKVLLIDATDCLRLCPEQYAQAMNYSIDLLNNEDVPYHVSGYNVKQRRRERLNEIFELVHKSTNNTALVNLLLTTKLTFL